MEKDILIVEENMMDNYEQETTNLKAILECPEFNIDTTPDPIQTQKPVAYKICRCGNALFESPKGQFRCSQCGCIKYKKNLGGR